MKLTDRRRGEGWEGEGRMKARDTARETSRSACQREERGTSIDLRRGKRRRSESERPIGLFENEMIPCDQTLAGREPTGQQAFFLHSQQFHSFERPIFEVLGLGDLDEFSRILPRRILPWFRTEFALALEKVTRRQILLTQGPWQRNVNVCSKYLAKERERRGFGVDGRKRKHKIRKQR